VKQLGTIFESTHASAQHDDRQRARCADTLVRRLTLLCAVSLTLGLAACGGGSVDVSVQSPPFDVTVMVGGATVNGVSIGPGATANVSMQVGQSIELDANEPVAWALYVGGTVVSGSGATVYYGGAAITQFTVSRSRIVVDTALASPAPLPYPLAFTFVATSTIDSAQVATINVTLTN